MSVKTKAAVNVKTSKEQAEELKRRARRRLVGSIVLLLATFIIVPAVIETEPERTTPPIELVTPGEPAPWEFDPERDLPPDPYEQESGKTEQTQSLAAALKNTDVQEKQSSSSSNTPAKINAEANNDQNVSSEKQDVAKTKATEQPKQTQENKSLTALTGNSSTQKPESQNVPVLPKQAPVSPSTDDPIERFAQADVFWVQVVAVSDRSRAGQLREKLKNEGFEARIESAGTDMGLIYRVRVGPIAGQQQAKGVKDKLQVAGYDGRIVQ